MAVQILDSAGSNKLGVDAGNAAMMTQRPPFVGANGAYRVCALTGLLTVVAAGTASAGHIFAARWSHVSKLCIITKLRARWVTVAGFTAGQEVGLDCFVSRTHSAAHTGGTGLTINADQMKKRKSHGSTTFADLRVSTTGALTNGTNTLDAQPIAWGAFSELAAGAAVPKGFFDMTVVDEATAGYPLILSASEGLVIRNTVLMGAGGTARVAIEMDWLEVDAY